MSLRDRALEDLPDEDSILGQPDSRWDERLGGLVRPGVWRRYEDGHGTSCEVYLVSLCALDGWSPDLLNIDPPQGRGFIMGAHLRVLLSGARALGWVLSPRQLPQPGDAYVSQHPTTEHAGVILNVKTRDDGLNLVDVETADAGQADAQGRQCARRQWRVLDVLTWRMTSGGIYCPVTALVRRPDPDCAA